MSDGFNVGIRKKSFTIFKVGYSVGVYGCSGEYFQLIVIANDEIYNYQFNGLYGAEDRISKLMEEKGFQEKYIYMNYSQVKTKDMKDYKSEHEITDILKRNWV